MKRLYAAADLTEAHLLLHLLGAEGIRARVLNEHAQGALGEIPFTQAYPELWLEDEQDLERALALVGEAQRRPVIHETVFCRRCREENPANFETCWACGAQL